MLTTVLAKKQSRTHFLWPPCIADSDIIFLSCFFFLFFLA